MTSMIPYDDLDNDLNDPAVDQTFKKEDEPKQSRIIAIVII